MIRLKVCNIIVANDIIVDIAASRIECKVACLICPSVFLMSKSNGSSYSIWNFKKHFNSEHLNSRNSYDSVVPDALDVEMGDAGAGANDGGAGDTEKKLLEMIASNNALQAKCEEAHGQILALSSEMDEMRANLTATNKAMQAKCQVAHRQILALGSEMDGMRANSADKGKFFRYSTVFLPEK